MVSKAVFYAWLTAWSLSAVNAQVLNDRCEMALPVTCGSNATGNTMEAAFLGPTFCNKPHTAPQLWYYIDAPLGWLQTTLCDGATWDTKLSVFAGQDCGSLTCVLTVDDSCGTQSDVNVTGIAGRVYLMVHGYGNSSGPFALATSCGPFDSNSFSDSPAPSGSPPVTVPGPFDGTNSSDSPGPIGSPVPADSCAAIEEDLRAHKSNSQQRCSSRSMLEFLQRNGCHKDPTCGFWECGELHAPDLEGACHP